MPTGELGQSGIKSGSGQLLKFRQGTKKGVIVWGGRITVTFLSHMLQVVMTPSSMRLAEPRLSLVGTHHGPGMHSDTSSGPAGE
jgi:hypothetical protein